MYSDYDLDKFPECMARSRIPWAELKKTAPGTTGTITGKIVPLVFWYDHRPATPYDPELIAVGYRHYVWIIKRDAAFRSGWTIPR